MAVLVAGVGYIGARIVERLLARGEEVVALDNFFSTDASAINRFRQQPGFRLIKGSITNRQTLHAAFSAAPISVVYLLAAQASAHPEAATVRYTENANLLGPRLLLDCMREFGVAKIVYASSFKVYGPALPAVVGEDVPYGQFGDFSHLSKCYAEKLLEMYASRYSLTCLPVRLGVTYGVSPVMKRDYRFMTAPNKFCLQAVLGEEVELYPGSDLPAGFVHVTDAADAMLAAAEAELPGYAPINAVTEMCSVEEAAKVIATEAARRGLNLHVKNARGASEAPGPTIVVRSRLHSFFDQPRRQLQDSVGEIIDYFRITPDASGRV